ncbi:Pyrroline-5-carboxylate reductase [Caballeronia sordidicola]|uniref:Pyrroline-5-carboxylate reductase n=1 Tax=Caballeronia sordidicola TaxID=196367 RepID=A0A158FRV5_CABSO|nr:pyrroline-5-carboxylate reductase [Caballeronia sordidicola]SAL22109.1 Pyrroline-5-carboxylate reductase [Caballeronia sordidicola]
MTETVTLGFVGSGDITHAIVTGIFAQARERYEVWLSPRNAHISKELADRYPGVHVARDNQHVVDQAEIVFLAVRPQIASEVLGTLSFNPDQYAVSLIAGYGTEKVRDSLRKAPGRIVRALPLPMVAQAASQTVLYPKEARVRDIFDSIGGSLGVASEDQFDTMLALSASMGLFFATAHAQSSWACRRGVDYEVARSYLMSLCKGLASAALLGDIPLDALSQQYSTGGGINEQVVSLMTHAGLFENIDAAYDSIEQRLVATREPNRRL